MQLSCSRDDIILDHPVLGSCKVTEIYYRHRVINVAPLAEPAMQCPLQRLISTNLATDVYKLPPSRTTLLMHTYMIYHETVRLFLEAFQYPTAMIYMAQTYKTILPSTKKRVQSSVLVKQHSLGTSVTLPMSANSVNVKVDTVDSVHEAVKHSASPMVPMSSQLRSRYNEEINMKVEMFLKAYGTSKPTRYTFRDVKKIARRFKDKLGQGGFGSVYKGELPNGVPVAVKMLESSTGEGEDFINEVATIGLIHHANIVRLLGFCSEGMRRALIYEFMPNESLEKYIFPQVPNISRQLLAPNKMLDIALGIARGMEYLHQGCNQRILHFDIKPHNILLDYNFNPKISDFGLAKLCARDQSIITLTAARGTMGYIAPEVYSRNFGGVSYKSDVYSFGMLVLEMVSGRRNSDPSVEYQDEVYLPEWVYERVISGHEWELTSEMTGEEKEKMRQLTIVALWCIQWNPKNRPSMTKVVNMLTGRLQNLQIPPKPFVSSENHHPRT
ncbi:rust resistance kinase Lr10-like [Hordeum vulgare subsp. vulgare]|uniref:rust resistance kinase Lr10-like n=1 Tax=Hordeum vulgare subsp. vulgare TaxID=112509 RepID=UPI001D1A4A11|nr:rust resistance kinase Lr10-like [Hordeum vulgare subsp. vulgare]XP_044971838.1 rust resistance kinase Lr10-like [Hordeum vulgare subsp. vulgare]